MTFFGNDYTAKLVHTNLGELKYFVCDLAKYQVSIYPSMVTRNATRALNLANTPSEVDAAIKANLLCY